MNAADSQRLLQHIRRLAGDPPGAATDGELLQRYLVSREEAAFAAVVRRHGAMVYSVCQSVLRQRQDAEDAFQAAFLILARKAGSIRCHEGLGGWLQRVAYRVALKARSDNLRRQHCEANTARSAVAEPSSDDLSWGEMRAILHAELATLPERFRVPLVLCYLEGLTQEEAARQLGWTAATVKGRLQRGRDKLRRRLERRGIALTAALGAALTAQTLAETAVRSSGLLTRTNTTTAAMALAREFLRPLLPLKLVMLSGLMLSMGVGIGGMALHSSPAEPRPLGSDPFPAEPVENPPAPRAAIDRFGDPLPERAVARMGTIRFRMNGLVGACAWSPDGKTLAAGENIGIVPSTGLSLFDAATGKLLRQLRDHQWIITSLAYSPDGRILAAGSLRAIVLWDVATGMLLRRWGLNPGQGKQVWSLAFTPDGKGLISAGGKDVFSAGEGDTRVHLWDPATGKEIRQFTGHEKDVRCAVLSPDGKTLASAADKEIRLWEMATGKLIRRLTGQKEPIRALAFSPDGKLLASGGADYSGTSSIWLWETAAGKVHLRLLPADKEYDKGFTIVLVRALAFSPDGKTLAAGYADSTLRLWDAATGKKLHETPGLGTSISTGSHDGGIQGIVFSRDGKRLVYTRDNQLALLDVPSGKVIQPLPVPGGTVERVLFSADGKHLFTTNAALDQSILEWDASSGRLIRQILPGKLIEPHRVRFSPDRKILFTTTMWESKAQLWDTITSDEIRTVPFPFLTKTNRDPRHVAFSPDGKLLAVEEFFGKAVWLIDVATGKQLCTVEGMKCSEKNATGYLTFSSDGQLLAMVDSATIHFAEVPSGRRLPPIVLPKGRSSHSIALSPDGRTLAIPCWGDFTGQSLLLLETATGKERLVLAGPRIQAGKPAFSPDGRLLATGGQDGIVLVWDMVSGKQVARLEGHQGYVESLAFSPDGRRLASGSRDTTALIWDVSGLAKKLRRRDPLTRQELDDLWSTLGSADAAKAYQAILTLEARPDQTMPLFAQRLRRKSPADAKRIAPLLTQLDSDSFQERERATKELREMGWAAESALCKALEGEPSTEARRRAKELLDNIQEQTLRMLRGIEVLEHIGTAEARQLLRELAKGAEGATLTRAAQAALNRKK